jgi:hypothetical protein
VTETGPRGGEPPAEGGEAIDQAGEQRSARIESLRALAALAVLIGHVEAFSIGLRVGVTGDADLNPLERLVYGGGVGVFSSSPSPDTCSSGPSFGAISAAAIRSTYAAMRSTAPFASCRSTTPS